MPYNIRLDISLASSGIASSWVSRFIIWSGDTVSGVTTNKKIPKVYVTTNTIFSLICRRVNLLKPFWFTLKQTRANYCPPLPMRLLCLVISSETTGFTRLLQKLRAKLRANWASLCNWLLLLCAIICEVSTVIFT